MSDNHMPEQDKSGQQQAEQEQDVNQSSGGPGAALAAGREKLGLTQKQVAQSLRLRLTSIQAIENNELEEGVSLTFTKGYVRLYAKLVNLEVQPLLDAHNKIYVEQTQPTKLQSFSRRTTRETTDSRWNIVSIIVVFLLLGSLVVWWIDREGYFADDQTANPSQTRSTNENTDSRNEDLISEKIEEPNIQGPDEDEIDVENDAELPGESPEQQSDADVPLEAPSEGPSTEPEPSQVSSEQPTELPDEIDNSALDDSDLIDTLNTEISDVRQSLLDSGYQVNDDGTVEVVFTFADDCWVSVKDAYGEIMAIGVKDKGRVMQVSGVPPIALILGAPQAVSINFGGVEVDMSPYPSTNTANFSLPEASN
ncbi:RodZ domain-containing protein [Glaciecola petra]|uniref:DUF4115 domain-containing protein n=1 Tax=Glaciecola petra TaxID=3075602 RepID=A0ABU2ZUZ7_9ALTE|nr:RodZ domain-containing protein [Aestuariibacter sp. P117]MDT0595868.1 DUF4115 domain-containing protein [Aestuariibacter sp. P117]